MSLPYRLSQLSFHQWCWVWIAYWQLWLVRIKLNLSSGMEWLKQQCEFTQSMPSTMLGIEQLSNNHQCNVAIQMYESVRLAARCHHGELACLPRSLVLKKMLLNNDIPAKLAIGVVKEKQQLVSHAWVEVNGVAISEPEAVKKGFARLV